MKRLFMIKNLITGEVKGKVYCYTLAAAQEYFDTFLILTKNDMLFEVK